VVSMLLVSCDEYASPTPGTTSQYKVSDAVYVYLNAHASAVALNDRQGESDASTAAPPSHPILCSPSALSREVEEEI
ncbi:hypothetical protein KIPB_014028, partial [Kipferlia bialata]